MIICANYPKTHPIICAEFAQPKPAEWANCAYLRDFQRNPLENGANQFAHWRAIGAVICAEYARFAQPEFAQRSAP